MGDAEDTWPLVIEDVAARRLKPRYDSKLTAGARLAAPRRDLFRQTSRHVAYAQLSRGCSNQCRFCYLQYLPHALRGLPGQWRHCASPALLALLASTSWSYYRSPVLRD